MTRNAIRTVLATVVLSLAAAPVLVGCKASASMQAGGGDPKPPPPPPPPPPAATTPPPPAATTPPPATPPPATIKPPAGGGVDGDKVTVPGSIVYETGKDVIKPESEPTLVLLKKFMDENPQVTLMRIEGHTDSDGDASMNQKLSGARALAVVKWMVAKGISSDRLIAVGFGKDKPIADNSTKDGKAQNRRTEFHMAALDGKSYKNRAADGGGTVYK